MRATLREIARQAKVHQSTASYVLNSTGGSTRVSEETRQRVLEVARRLGYTANRAAQQLRTRRSNVIGLLVGELENPFFARLVALCTAELERAGYESVLAMRRHGEVSDLHLLQTLTSRQVDGLLLWSESVTEVREWFEKSERVPEAVILGYRMPGVDSVEAALHQGVQEALEHLLEQGFERIGYLAPAASLNSVGDPRPAFYRDAMTDAGRTPCIYTYEGPAHQPEAARIRAEEIAQEPPEKRPDALFCFNDMTAFGALMGLRRKGLRVPQDVALVGCDNLPLVAQLDVPLSSIVFPLEEICKSAVRMLLERVEASRMDEPNQREPRYELIPTSLTVRESSIRPVMGIGC